jgi:hypothetical protein
MRTYHTIFARLDGRSGILFLVAGGMLFIATANNALGAYTSLTTQAGLPLALEAVAGFGGIVIAFIGLVGLYPRLADSAPRLARIGVGLVALPAVVFVVLVTCAIPAGLLGLPSPAAVIPALDAVVIAAFLMVAVGVAALGVRSLSHTVGTSLLVLAVAWFLLFGAAYLNGFPISNRVVVGTGVMQMAALFGAGYGLRLDAGTANRADSLVDHSTAD